jgi:hypothetical protein
MKKSIFLAMAAVVVMFFTGCSKDIDLAGTTWKSNTISASYQGMTMTLDMVLNFKDATNYDLTANVTAPIIGTQSTTESGTYTFDGENGVFDGEQNFSYNKKDKTLVINIDDAEMTQMFGTSTLTFTQQK